jgi:hypothetical protein
MVQNSTGRHEKWKGINPINYFSYDDTCILDFNVK